MFSDKALSEGLRLVGFDFEAMPKEGQIEMRNLVENMAKQLNDPFLIEAGSITMTDEMKKKFASEESRDTAEYVSIVVSSFRKI